MRKYLNVIAAFVFALQVVLNKVPHLSSAHSLKANPLHRPSNLLPALLQVILVLKLRLTKDL